MKDSLQKIDSQVITVDQMCSSCSYLDGGKNYRSNGNFGRHPFNCHANELSVVNHKQRISLIIPVNVVCVDYRSVVKKITVSSPGLDQLQPIRRHRWAGVWFTYLRP